VRPLWQPRIALLLGELRKAPAVLRLSYVADVEDPRLVDQRVATVKQQIKDAWKASEDCCAYELVVEPEVFWRRGEPPSAAELRTRAAGDAHE
jgi:hypothetical protein